MHSLEYAVREKIIFPMVTFLFRQIKATERKAKGLFHMQQSGFDQSFINMKA